jgi:hypothetical protein
MDNLGYQVRPVTQRLMSNLALDLPLTPAQIYDFGVETEMHYRALKAVLFNDEPGSEELDESEIQRDLQKRLAELDQACGNGPALTALVKKYAPEFVGITFKTPYDLRRALEGKSGQQER